MSIEESGDEFTTQMRTGSIKVTATESGLYKVVLPNHNEIEVEYVSPEASSWKQVAGETITTEQLEEISFLIEDHYM